MELKLKLTHPCNNLKPISARDTSSPFPLPSMIHHCFLPNNTYTTQHEQNQPAWKWQLHPPVNHPLLPGTHLPIPTQSPLIQPTETLRPRLHHPRPPNPLPPRLPILHPLPPTLLPLRPTNILPPRPTRARPKLNAVRLRSLRPPRLSNPRHASLPRTTAQGARLPPWTGINTGPIRAAHNPRQKRNRQA